VKDIFCITTIYAKSLDALGSNSGEIAGPTVECLMKTPQKGALMTQTVMEKYILFGNYLIPPRTVHVFHTASNWWIIMKEDWE